VQRRRQVLRQRRQPLLGHATAHREVLWVLKLLSFHFCFLLFPLFLHLGRLTRLLFSCATSLTHTADTWVLRAYGHGAEIVQTDCGKSLERADRRAKERERDACKHPTTIQSLARARLISSARRFKAAEREVDACKHPTTIQSLARARLISSARRFKAAT
jgi:hypothetical protein